MVCVVLQSKDQRGTFVHDPPGCGSGEGNLIVRIRFLPDDGRTLFRGNPDDDDRGSRENQYVE
jgi:hypothetical protein